MILAKIFYVYRHLTAIPRLSCVLDDALAFYVLPIFWLFSKTPVQFIKLYCFNRLLQFLQLQVVEIFCTSAGFFQKPFVDQPHRYLRLLRWNWRAEKQVGNEDLHRCQRALWGKLGYKPAEQQPGLFMLTVFYAQGKISELFPYGSLCRISQVSSKGYSAPRLFHLVFEVSFSYGVFFE